MQREWKASGEGLADADTAPVLDNEVSLPIDQAIIDDFQKRWPDSWREKMAEVITAAAGRL